MRHWAWWAFLIVSLAAALRLPQLTIRPMHADEAIQADKFGSLLEHRTFQYDPRDYHGPVLAYLTVLPAIVSGQTTYASLTEATLRVVPALLGVAITVVLLLLRKAIGEKAALFAGLLWAVSTPAVYYSRFYIAETPLVFFTALGLLLLYYATEQSSPLAWASVGVAAGLALAAKETALIALVSVSVAYLWVYRPRWQRTSAAALAVGFAVPILLLLGPSDLPSALRSYWQRGVGGGWHAHPWRYYLDLLMGRSGLYTEALLLTLAGSSYLLRQPSRNVRLLQITAALTAVIYSIIPYKTPWCVLTIVLLLSLLAGVAAAGWMTGFRWPLLLMLLAGSVHSSWQAWRANTADSADPGNQWVYAQTTPAVLDLIASIERCAVNSPQGYALPIRVYTRQNLWPLPWYLRRYSGVRWSREVLPAGSPTPVILATPEMDAAVLHLLYEAPPPGERQLYTELWHPAMELRPGVSVRGYVTQSLWESMQ